jgi:hypothetical protein
LSAVYVLKFLTIAKKIISAENTIATSFLAGGFYFSRFSKYAYAWAKFFFLCKFDHTSKCSQ